MRGQLGDRTGGPREADVRAQTLPEILQQRARAATAAQQRGYLFLADGEREADARTWGELDRRARRLAVWMRRVAKAGDRALLLFPAGSSWSTPSALASTPASWRCRCTRPGDNGWSLACAPWSPIARPSWS